MKSESHTHKASPVPTAALGVGKLRCGDGRQPAREHCGQPGGVDSTSARPLGKPRGLYGSFRLKWGQSAQAGVGPAVSAWRSLPSPGMSRELVRFGDFQGIVRGSLGEQKGQGPGALGPALLQPQSCAVQPRKVTRLL